MLTFTCISEGQRTIVNHLIFFTSLNRGGSQNWWPRCSPAHCFNELPPKCLNLGGKSTAGCLPVKTPIACRQILGFFNHTAYLYFCKNCGLLFLLCFWSLTSFSFSQVYSPLQHPAFLPQRDKISSEDKFLLPLFNYPFPSFYMPILIP